MDVAAVLLTLGEPTTGRALGSARAQADEVVVVDGVRPFYRALNHAATRVRAPFFVQVDADMVLDPDCFERLREAMDADVAIAVGALRDPLMGKIAGVKMFRRECFDLVQLGDTPAREVEFYVRLGELGWRTACLTGEALGRHEPGYTSDYVFGACYLLGVRYGRGRDARGLRWRLGRLRDSRHPLAPVARVAMSHGLFGNETRDVARPQPSPADARFLRELAAAPEHPPDSAVADLMELAPRPLFYGFRELGAALRATSPAGLIGCLREIARDHHDNSLLAEAGLGHGALAGRAAPVPAGSLAWLG